MDNSHKTNHKNKACSPLVFKTCKVEHMNFLYILISLIKYQIILNQIILNVWVLMTVLSFLCCNLDNFCPFLLFGCSSPVRDRDVLYPLACFSVFHIFPLWHAHCQCFSCRFTRLFLQLFSLSCKLQFFATLGFFSVVTLWLLRHLHLKQISTILSFNSTYFLQIWAVIDF